MPGSYNVTRSGGNGHVMLTARGDHLTETFAAALTGLLDAAGVLLAAPAHASGPTEIAVPIRGEGGGPIALFADLVADIQSRFELESGMFAPLELDGVIRTDEGLSAWGYLHGQAASRRTPITLHLVEPPVVESDNRGNVIGLTARLRIDPPEEATSS